MRRALAACLLLAVLLGAGCADQRRPHGPSLVEGGGMPPARYALLFGNISAGYRDADGSAEGLLWLVDDAGEVVGESPRFAPIAMARMRATAESLYFVGEAAGYTLNAHGLTTHPRPEHDTGDIRFLHIIPGGGAVASVNIGVGESGLYRTDLMYVNDPDKDRTLNRYIEAISTCGDRSYLLTTEGLSPTDARWEDYATGEVLAETSDESIDGISAQLPCKDSLIYAVEQKRTATGEVEALFLTQWDSGQEFTGRSIPLLQADGRVLGIDGTWDDGGRNPVYYWIDDSHLTWNNTMGEVWTADLRSGAARRVFQLPSPDGSSYVSDTPEGDSIIRAYAAGKEIKIARYSIPDGAVLDEVTVPERPQPMDLAVVDAVAVGGRHEDPTR